MVNQCGPRTTKEYSTPPHRGKQLDSTYNLTTANCFVVIHKLFTPIEREAGSNLDVCVHALTDAFTIWSFLTPQPVHFWLTLPLHLERCSASPLHKNSPPLSTKQPANPVDVRLAYKEATECPPLSLSFSLTSFTPDASSLHPFNSALYSVH